ncbi:chromatin remodelling complex Rsc7/Swp82 subunit-domain-containing protein [Fimicolochytrium jonesii]|uniref:chromatin remodelling complex Rsc7/Swp82 subunit-domain-containing protein n=1 Tax=Fimicolochytrium jonesii TaxID=1396493 RepID=UPI0022FF0794|nr:chromatin remodelling complex Rsc7/Swp82 subunit-domain-containing protein [Fimicolochytrium jonesii]KAI8819321.1 chromatin remodelling complex Rsc7/Swp82 subunit-domain-containing protein [Fimicolochytrium jonesii]
MEDISEDESQNPSPTKRTRGKTQDAQGSNSPARRSGRNSGKTVQADGAPEQDEADDLMEVGDDGSKENIATPKEEDANGKDTKTDEAVKTELPKAASGTSATPAPRGRGRPSKGSDTPRDTLGVKNVDEEENETEWDEKGELKITKDGELLGGREYKIKSFILPRHPKRRYMLTVDISKGLQYRDTYIFFLKNPHITRIQGDEKDKAFLEEHGILPGQLRRRPVSIASARSIFRAFGHKCIKRGKPVRDDYWVGDQEEPPDEPEPEEPEDTPLPPRRSDSRFAQPMPRESTLRRQMHRMTHEERERLMPFSTGNRILIPALAVGDEQLYKRAASAADFNRRLRLQRSTSFFDTHTNIEQMPSLSQPQSISVEMKVGSIADIARGNGLSIVQNTDPTDSDWVRVEIPPEDELYPIAIIPGQYQGAFPVARNRFSASDVVPADPTPAAAPNVKDITRASTPAPVALPLPQSASKAAASPAYAIPKVRHAEYTCGEITRTGLPCKRVVFTANEKCLYHAKAVDVPAVDPNACVHCHSITPSPAQPTTKPLPNILLSCASCKTKHHPSCIDFDDAVLINKVQTYSWHCSDCKTCVKCHKAGDDSRLLFCDTCDRGYHTFCLEPPLDEAPEGTWLCPLCAVCASCATTKATDWKHAIIPPEPEKKSTSYGTYLCTYCPDCYRQFEASMFCPVCMGMYKEDEEAAMVCCDACDRWIHVACDATLTSAQYEKLVEDSDSKYTCLLCDDTKIETLRTQDSETPVTGDGVKVERKVIEFDRKKMVVPIVGKEKKRKLKS